MTVSMPRSFSFIPKLLQLTFLVLVLGFSPIASKAEYIQWSYTYLTGEVASGFFDASRGSVNYENIVFSHSSNLRSANGEVIYGFVVDNSFGPQTIRVDGTGDGLAINIAEDQNNSGFHGFSVFNGMVHSGQFKLNQGAPGGVQYSWKEAFRSEGWHLESIPDSASTLALLGISLLGLAALRRRFQRK